MILHADMDAFYASVEERERPELVGHPVIVGGSHEKRGVVAAANYVARKYGVHSAMPAATAHRLWGVGKQASKVFQRLGIRTVGQFRQWPSESLRARFGSSGEHLWQLAHGIDDRAVVPEREAKSISHETTFERDIADLEVLRAWLLDLTEQVGWRLRRHGLRGRTVHLKVRFADFRTITRSQTLPEPTDITQELWQAAEEMFCNRLPAGHLPVRLLGMGVSGFDESGLRQGLLFDQEDRQRQAGVDAVADEIRERFGSSALRRGTSLEPRKPKTDQEESEPPQPGSG